MLSLILLFSLVAFFVADRLICKRKPDPVKDCYIYNRYGCSHVDGVLCDMDHCHLLQYSLAYEKFVHECREFFEDFDLPACPECGKLAILQVEEDMYYLYPKVRIACPDEHMFTWGSESLVYELSAWCFYVSLYRSQKEEINALDLCSPDW